jgi:methylthioribose-1-phosphate isomerase
MLVNGVPYQSIWFDNEKQTVFIIDQRKLPFRFEVLELKTMNQAFKVIQDMTVRGAPLIGVTATYGMYLGIKNHPSVLSGKQITEMGNQLKIARPTAINLAKIIDTMVNQLLDVPDSELEKKALKLAIKAEKNEIYSCEQIGNHGLKLIEAIAESKNGQPVNILTHCNAGWLACVDWGTATAPIYKAHQKGIPVHVWVDETRPRNQGARLTAWEFEGVGIPYTVIPDNTGGHLMQHQQVDLVLVGSDRTTLNGDVANKIGTYLKALAAHDNHIPFYVALPSSSIDFTMVDEIVDAFLMPPQTPVANYGFDVTPARLVTGLLTERGICTANQAALLTLYPEYKK